MGVLTKDIVVDLVQILSDRQIQVREIRRVLEDGVVIATGDYHRFVLDPGIHEVEDVKKLNDELGAVTEVMWTPEVIAARKEFLATQEAIRLASIAEVKPVDVNPVIDPIIKPPAT